MKVRIRTDKDVMLAIVDLDWHLYGKYEFCTQDLTVGTNSYPSYHRQYLIVSANSYPIHHDQYTNSYPRHHAQYEFVPEITPLVQIRTQK
jgi:hypothetical protein